MNRRPASSARWTIGQVDRDKGLTGRGRPLAIHIWMSARQSTMYIAATVAGIVAVVALTARVGADAQWLAALGHVIIERRSIPTGVPFATAATSHWPNSIVLAELVFDALEQGLGDRGLMLAQLLAVAAALGFLARDAREGGAEAPGISVALLLAALGALPALAIARVQLFSLVLFPLLVSLLRAQHRRPSRRIWLVVPLLALWANLHGTVLLGLAVVFAYLLCSRARREPIVAAGVGLASTAALCLTPALASTVDYYHGLVTNVAAERGQGMWSALSLGSAFDLLLIGAAVALSVWAFRARPQLWEWAVLAGLAAETIHASRTGIWLLLFLVGPAARSIKPLRTWRALLVPVGVASLAAIAFAVAGGPALAGASPALVQRALALARGTPVLAEDAIAEQVALAGGRIWVGNPVDAFSHRDQGIYLDWVQGDPAGRRALNARIRVVLASRGSPAQRLMSDASGYAVVSSDRTTSLYELRSPAATSCRDPWSRRPESRSNGVHLMANSDLGAATGGRTVVGWREQ